MRPENISKLPSVKRVGHPRIRVLESYLATEILFEKGTVKGVKAMNCRTGAFGRIECKWLILATGGAGQLYKF